VKTDGAGDDPSAFGAGGIPSDDAWAAWNPLEAATVLPHLTSPWCVVGGWAIDLWFGRQTRPHSDLEIAVPRTTAPRVLQLLAPLQPHAVGSGQVRALAPGEAPPEDRHQVWMLDPAAGVWRVDVMLEPGDDETWVYRRDPRLSMPRRRAQAARSSIPYLNPELVLLFKAKAQREKDSRDFSLCVTHLDSHRKSRLQEWLRGLHPGHPWIEALERSARPGSAPQLADPAAELELAAAGVAQRQMK